MRDKNSKRKIVYCKKLKKYLGYWFVNIVISKLVKTKANSKYLIGYLDKAIKSLVLIIPKINEYVKICKVKDG